MVGPDAVLVLGRSAFHDVVSAKLTCWLCRADLHCANSLYAKLTISPSFMTQNFSCCVSWQALTSSGDLSYLGAQWRRDVAFAGYGIPLQVMYTDALSNFNQSQSSLTDKEDNETH